MVIKTPPVQKILYSREKEEIKTCWVWKLRKVYIPLHKEREQETREEKSHYVQMVTFHRPDEHTPEKCESKPGWRNGKQNKWQQIEN